RPKTAEASRASPSPATSPGSDRASTGAPAGARPARSATAATVRGSSPDRIFTATPSEARNRSASGASGRRRSSNVTTATGRRPGGNRSPSSPSGAEASRRTRRPAAASASAAGTGPVAETSTSAPPSTHDPRPSKLTALHLRAEEKATASVAVQQAGAGQRAARARRV